MSNTAIIIPCFNEEKRLKKEMILTFLQENPSYSLFFVDDGSTDKTALVLEEIKATIPSRIFLHKNKCNMGKAESVRKGILQAFHSSTCPQIGFLDADLSTPFSEFVKLNQFLIKNNKKAVFGSRFKKVGATIERSQFRHIMGRIIATAICWTIKMPFYDTQCGAKVFARDVVPKLFHQPFVSRWLFDVEIILRLKSIFKDQINNYIYEFPISIWMEVEGSKVKLSDGIRTPFELLKIKRKYKK